MINLGTQRYAFFALGAAALFGAGTPIAKFLLQDIEPAMLAALLYLGSGMGLFVARVAGRAIRRAAASDGQAPPPVRPPIDRAHFVWLAAAIASGGVAAPLLLMWGLSRSSAANAALLLNAESVLTSLLAALLFSEHVGRRVWLASLVMLAAGVLLSWSPAATSSFALSPGALAVIGACFFWGLDNNFTRRIAGGDATTIAMAKGLTAGAVNLLLALAVTMAAAWPPFTAVAGALLLGALAYGGSLVLYVRALRHLGSARTAAHFATAPFVGAGVALLMGEPAAPVFLIALGLMVLATWLVLSERHVHSHSHEAMAHTHAHIHDEHHHHRHDTPELEAEARAGKAHTHFHVHEPLTHLHPHLPDLHHRHVH